MDDVQWITSYLHQHSLSEPTRRYAYLFYALIILILFVLSLLRFAAASFAVSALRRFTIRRKTIRFGIVWSAPYSLPNNGQLLSLVALTCTTFVLAFAGPDSGLKSPIDSVTASKTVWQLAARNGDIAFALFPICVFFVLKSPPFAIFSFFQLHFDKLAWLHRWTGKLIWIVSALHVGLWSVQLVRDKHPETAEVAYNSAWKYQKFVYGWVAFGLLTLLMLSSVTYFRRNFYQTFHNLHLVLVPGTLAMAALHHPPIQVWCWGAMALWLGERCWRAVLWVYINGLFRGASPSGRSQLLLPVSAPRGAKSGHTSPFLFPQEDSFYTGTDLVATGAAFSYSPPPGFAYVQLLSGHTMRLTYTPMERIKWAPGQHFLLRIPSISKFSTHPFSCASISDDEAPGSGSTTLVFLISAKGGWTKDLWIQVTEMLTSGQTHVPGETPPRSGAELPRGFGVLLKMSIEGPFGGVADTDWGAYSTLLIICGGSGITFGLPIMEFACMALAGRDGQKLGGKSGGWGRKGFAMRRIRLIWLVRDFSHLQWAAAILNRCISMIPDGLQVNVFVTNHALVRNPPTSGAPIASQERRTPIEYEDEDDDDDSLIDISAYTTSFGDEEPRIGAREDYTRELTSFYGDDDNFLPLPGEDALNHTVRIVGRNSRAISKSFSFTGMKAPVLHRPSAMQQHVAMTPDGIFSHEEADEPPSRSSLESTASWSQSARMPQSLGMKEHRPSAMQQHVTITSDGKVISNEEADEPTTAGVRSSLESTASWSQSATMPKRLGIKEAVYRPSAMQQHVTITPDGIISSEDTEEPTNASRRSSLESTSSDIGRQPQITIFDAPSLPNPMTQERSFARPSLPTLTVPTRYPPSMHSYNSPNSSTHDWASSSAEAFDLDTSRNSLVSPFTSTPDGGFRLRIPEEEMENINAVAEFARPGKPKLAAILSHEVERSTGSVVVACCGPVSLNALVRKIIAQQINPSRIRRGDSRGKIDLVSEEFSF